MYKVALRFTRQFGEQGYIEFDTWTDALKYVNNLLDSSNMPIFVELKVKRI